MRITFSSCFRDYMVYGYYLKQPKALCEIRLYQILAKNPRLINCFKKYSNHPLFEKIPTSRDNICEWKELRISLKNCFF